MDESEALGDVCTPEDGSNTRREETRSVTGQGANAVIAAHGGSDTDRQYHVMGRGSQE